MLEMAEFWVPVAFVLFGHPPLLQGAGVIAKALDDRAEAIRKEIDEARRLREEAQSLLADYQQKHRTPARRPTRSSLARREAEAFAQETRKSLKETLERRTRLAEEKIARAEAQAVDEVRAAAVELAIAAAEKILREKAAGAAGTALIDQGIRDLKGRLN